MNALINPNEPVKHTIAWELNPNWNGNPKTKYLPINEIIPNAQRVCEVAENTFEIGEPLFWMECANDVIADQFYYDDISKTIKPIVNEPMPV
jgi:hypothetical protein